MNVMEFCFANSIGKKTLPIYRWNAEYWRLKREIVGVTVPVLRGSEDLDPPTLFHIAQDYDMIR